MPSQSPLRRRRSTPRRAYVTAIAQPRTALYLSPSRRPLRQAFAQTLPGITAPFGFFDPAGFCSSDGASNEQVSEGKVRFYREVELKHGRVAMLAALGFPVAEQFHPLFATDDAPSFSAFQQTPLQTFWPVVVGVIAVIEVFSVFTFENPASRDADGNPAQPWTIKKDHAVLCSSELRLQASSRWSSRTKPADTRASRTFSSSSALLAVIRLRR